MPSFSSSIAYFFSVLGHSVEKQKLDGLLINFQNIGLILTLFWRHKFLIFQSIFIEFIWKENEIDEEFYNSVWLKQIKYQIPDI